MRHDAPFLVKRYAPLIGRPNSQRRIITTAFNAYTLDSALVEARDERTAVAHIWIERRGQSATRRQSPRT